MDQTAGDIKVIIVGASGIGRIHVREFARAGAKVLGIVGRNRDRAQQTVARLNREFDLDLIAFESLDAALSSDAQAISVCTPHEAHFDQLMEAFSAGKYVFCEKPLFWAPSFTYDELTARLDKIAAACEGRLLVNTSNAYFVEAARQNFGFPKEVEAFGIKFHTNGKAEFENIGPDLLPHAFSLALMFRTGGRITNLRKSVEKHSFACSFDLSGMDCRFDLRCNPDGRKNFSFSGNGLAIERVQKKISGKYAVFLRAHGADQREVPVDDPFHVYIRNFVETVRAGRTYDLKDQGILENMKLMGDVLLAK